ncbi:hypothetical protein V6Z88_007579 [Aspergillus fumigatus]
MAALPEQGLVDNVCETLHSRCLKPPNKRSERSNGSALGFFVGHFHELLASQAVKYISSNYRISLFPGHHQKSASLIVSDCHLCIVLNMNVENPFLLQNALAVSVLSVF